jgi:hypothetical protein
MGYPKDNPSENENENRNINEIYILSFASFLSLFVIL